MTNISWGLLAYDIFLWKDFHWNVFKPLALTKAEKNLSYSLLWITQGLATYKIANRNLLQIHNYFGNAKIRFQPVFLWVSVLPNKPFQMRSMSFDWWQLNNKHSRNQFTIDSQIKHKSAKQNCFVKSWLVKSQHASETDIAIKKCSSFTQKM